ncbi:MAG: hypothetical protein IPJ30_10270 [Acidobacteria bacterium]|nr:hypothetical protein [Acidobacteriota bacterium]
MGFGIGDLGFGIWDLGFGIGDLGYEKEPIPRFHNIQRGCAANCQFAAQPQDCGDFQRKGRTFPHIRATSRKYGK